MSIAFGKSRELIESTYSHCFRSKYNLGAQEGNEGSSEVANLRISLVFPAVADSCLMCLHRMFNCQILLIKKIKEEIT